jgi:ketosteroid isomerase-like protein
MDKKVEEQIVEAEEKLRQAMLNSDVKALDELLAPELIFTNHLGQWIGKQEDLAGHKSGALKLTSIEPFERHILLKNNVAIVAVKMQLSGTYEGTPAGGNFRFTRVWARARSVHPFECKPEGLSPQGTWQIIAGHSSIVD